jgi:hypothetical protein|tara:strand:+ start:1732 stop:2145 length:414 start_codon:yes stop_codon:yes gene_type:complete
MLKLKQNTEEGTETLELLSRSVRRTFIRFLTASGERKETVQDRLGPEELSLTILAAALDIVGDVMRQASAETPHGDATEDLCLGFLFDAVRHSLPVDVETLKVDADTDASDNAEKIAEKIEGLKAGPLGSVKKSEMH